MSATVTATVTTTVPAQGMKMPALLYGTAWKEARTTELTALAVTAGFRGVDTANQRKHYDEAAVGVALAACGVPRSELFLQSKFTYARGQDHRLPYDAAAPLATQVQQSFASSLEHLHTERLDSYLLHGPAASHGWSDADREVWRAMEHLHDLGQVRLLGISNVSLEQLRTLCDEARVAPAFVQNRCYARTGWDRALRLECAERGLRYQAFSLLTANRGELAAPAVAALADRHRVTVPQLVFAFARAVGMIPLTGTSSLLHMQEDLASDAVHLSDRDREVLEHLEPTG